MEKRRIAILGSTGSIGRQTLDVIREHRDLFEVELLTCNSNYELLASQAVEFDANNAVICEKGLYGSLSSLLRETGTKVFSGMESVCELVRSDRVDIVVAAMVGFSGLAPTISAIKAGKVIALANKETLVAAGALVMDLSKKHNAPILPVDSEHSAIFQCLMASQGNKLRKIHLTASGGPFRTWKKEEISLATKDAALRHPRWSMGAKITIDSATMMNKGFEVMEARWLFDTPVDRIEVVVHPESVVHSMVEFEDGAVIAQMASPDMRQPIQFAIGFPERLPLGNEKLDFAHLGSLSFFKADTDRFPALALAYRAMDLGGNIPCALNAANEIAVEAFLQDKVSFYGISDLLEACLEKTTLIANPSLEEIFETDFRTRHEAQKLIDRK